MDKPKNYRLDFMKIFRIIAALTCLLVSTFAQAQVQYCGSDSSQRTLVNRVLYSEQFDNAAFSKTGVTATANAVVAPDGETTAETLTSTATTNSHHLFVGSGYNAIAGSSYRHSVYVKAGTYNKIAIGEGGDAVVHGDVFNTSTLLFEQPTNISNSGYTELSNGWYRVWIEYVRTNTSAGALYVGNVSTHTPGRSFINGISWLAAGTETMHIWGAQANLVSDPNTYIRTTDTQVTAGLANTTPQVTLSNLLTYSEQFDNAAWVKPQSTVTANTVTAPDGTNTADTILETAVSNYHGVYQFVNVTSGLTYRMAVYAKAQNRSVIQIEGSTSAFGANAYASYNLANGTLGAVGSSAKASIVSVGDGWYLCTLIAPATATTTSAFNIHTATTIGAALRQVYLGVITNGVYLWGGYENLAVQPPDYLLAVASATTLGPLCPAGTSESLVDPTRCFAVTDNRIRRW
jgi:hypothetical protein